MANAYEPEDEDAWSSRVANIIAVVSRSDEMVSVRLVSGAEEVAICSVRPQGTEWLVATAEFVALTCRGPDGRRGTLGGRRSWARPRDQRAPYVLEALAPPPPWRQMLSLVELAFAAVRARLRRAADAHTLELPATLAGTLARRVGSSPLGRPLPLYRIEPSHFPADGWFGLMG